jgi:hypothetical protein
MFTLYHIKGKKWGCTQQKLSRRLWEQGLSMKDVCETIVVYSEEEANELEEKLNKQYGYPWKKSENYSHMLKIVSQHRNTKGFTEEQRLRGAKKGGKTAVESGQLLSICSMGGKVGGKIAGHMQSQKEYTCNVCGRSGRGNRFVNHIKNCSK